MDYSKIDDEALMRLVVRLNEDALSVLYDRYNRLVYSLALNSTGDPGLAEEITQDVFLRVWNKAVTYRPEAGKVITWLSSITRYRAIDMLRQLATRPEGNQVVWAESESVLPSVTPDVEDEVVASQSRQRIRRAMRELPAEQHLALGYAFFYGYSHSQIAEALGEPLGTVKTRIRLAMQKLRDLLGEEQHRDE